MKSSERVIYYTDKEQIDKIIEVLKKYSYEQLIKTEYFKISLMEKNTDEEVLKEYYNQFCRIKLIALRQREGKKSNYDIYYETDDKNAIIYAIDMNKSPPILINAFQFSRSLKRFTDYIAKKYKNQMV